MFLHQIGGKITLALWLLLFLRPSWMLLYLPWPEKEGGSLCTLMLERMLFKASTSDTIASCFGDDPWCFDFLFNSRFVYSRTSLENFESWSKLSGVSSDGDIVLNRFDGVGLVACVDMVPTERNGYSYFSKTSTRATLSSLSRSSIFVSRLK